MRRISSFFVRIFSFFRKELAEVLRQPKLILTLILGPFLILLLFGIGYNNQQPPVRTMFVVNPDNPFAEQIQSKVSELSYAIDLKGVTGDFEMMMRNLNRNAIDMGVVVPDNVYETIRANQQAKFEIFHNQIDPVQVSYLQYMGSFLSDAINRQVLQSFAEQGQTEAQNIEPHINSAIENTRSARVALENGDVESARQYQQATRSSVSSLQMVVGASAGLLQGINQNFGGQGGQEADILASLQAVQDSPALTEDIQEGQGNYDQEVAHFRTEEENLTKLQEQLGNFTAIHPAIMTRPFASEVQSISQVDVNPMSFFIPGVIVLLLQHMTITLSSLSLVRERRAGTMELFRVSPLKPIEVLFSKYFSYLFIGLFIAAVLALAVRFGLQSPMLGSWIDLLIVVLLLLFASLGVGFIISLLAETETQAVQFSMIALLFSVFFSGFFLDLRNLTIPVRYISYGIPATYGTQMMQNIMLRGLPIAQGTMLNLLAFGVILFLLAWMLLKRKMARE